MSDVTLRNGTVYKEPQAEKVEDSGSEADFGTKDKQESWEERFDHNFTGTANIITDFKAYVKARYKRLRNVCQS